MARICKACSGTKPAAEFYAGHASCKECVKARVRARYCAKPDQIAAYERMRYARDYDKRRALTAVWAQKNPDRTSAAKRAYAERSAEKRKAHIAVGNALRDGRISRPSVCSCCGHEGRIEAHHDDYGQPLAVRWLCTPCHSYAHHGDRAVSFMRARQP